MFIITSRQTNTKKNHTIQDHCPVRFIYETLANTTTIPPPPPNAIAGKRHSVQFGFTSAPAGANRAIPPVSFAALAPRSHVFILTDVKLEHQRVKLCNGQRAAAPKTAHTHTRASQKDCPIRLHILCGSKQIDQTVRAEGGGIFDSEHLPKNFDPIR